MRVIRCELLVHPSKVENAVNLPDQMIAWHYLVEIEGKKLALSAFPPTHHERLPPMPVSIQCNHRSRVVSMGVSQHNQEQSGHEAPNRHVDESNVTRRDMIGDVAARGYCLNL